MSKIIWHKNKVDRNICLENHEQMKYKSRFARIYLNIFKKTTQVCRQQMLRRYRDQKVNLSSILGKKIITIFRGQK
ncbi:hypothetical protein OIU78_021573 [Salix suchowensis]|nr:hypothetical protein OIU78_021573 [Salix suchowensis]